MSPTNKEKLEYAAELLKKGFTYRNIQEELQRKFKSAVSNSTLRKLKEKLDEDDSKDIEIARLRKELEIFKDLYFELLEKVKSKFPDENFE